MKETTQMEKPHPGVVVSKNATTTKESLVVANASRAEYGIDGYCAQVVIRHSPAPYGAGNFDFRAFDKALNQFLAKWNESAIKACTENEYGKNEAK